MTTFYLVGQITTHPETYAWRRNMRIRFNEEKNIKLIDPCNHEFSRRCLKEAKDGNFRKIASFNLASAILPVRDAQYVMQSDGAIANLNWYTPETPLLGTFFELAWYKMQPWKTVIGIYDGDPQENYICYHPFVKSTVHVWVKNEEEAGDILVDLFL